MNLKSYKLEITDYPKGKDAYNAHETLGMSAKQYTHGLGLCNVKKILNIAKGKCAEHDIILEEVPASVTPDMVIHFVMFATDGFPALRDKDSGHRSDGSAFDGNTLYLSPSLLSGQYMNNRSLQDKAGHDFDVFVASVLADEIKRFPVVEPSEDDIGYVLVEDK